MDHFGLIGLDVRPANLVRVGGVVLLVAGAIMVGGARLTRLPARCRARITRPLLNGRPGSIPACPERKRGPER